MKNHNESKLKVFKKSCESIIEKEGACVDLRCEDCPFSRQNNGFSQRCGKLYTKIASFEDHIDNPMLVKRANEFISGELYFNNNGKLVKK